MTAQYDDRVLDAAGKLFSQLGYDSTTLSMIAAVVGDSDTALLRTNKESLYVAVLGRLHAIETGRLEAVVRDAPKDVRGIHVLLDTFIDTSLERPEFGALWMQRGFMDAAEIEYLEQKFPAPLPTIMCTHPWEGLRSDIDLQLIAWMIVWGVNGFLRNGLPDESGMPRYADDPALVTNFRLRMHELVRRMS